MLSAVDVSNCDTDARERLLQERNSIHYDFIRAIDRARKTNEPDERDERLETAFAECENAIRLLQNRVEEYHTAVSRHDTEKARWGTVESFSNQVIFLAVLFFTLVSMGLYRSPAVALMPDVTPNHLRSRANAVINLMGAVGGVYALIMIKVLVGKGDTPDYLPLFASIAAVMAIAVGILVITIRENKLREEVEKAEAAGVSKAA